MNDYVAKITLDLNCQATPVVISAGQFDVGRKIQITLTADGEAYDVTGATAICKGKSGDNHFAVEAVVSNNTVTVTTDKAMLSSAGRTVAKIVLTDGTRTYSTQPFVINTHSDYDGDVTASDYYPVLMDILDRVIALTDSGAVLTDSSLDAESINPVQNKVLTTVINSLINDKADRATTLDGYGITDAYTKDKTNSLLKNKLDSMPFDVEPQVNSPCYITSGAVYAALLNKVDKSAFDTQSANVQDLSSEIKSARGDYDNLNQRLGEFIPDDVGVINTFNLADGAVITPIIANAAVTAPKIAYGAVGLSQLSSIVQQQVSSIGDKANSDDVTAKLALKYDSSNIEYGKGTLSPASTNYEGSEGSFNYAKIGKIVTVAINVTALIVNKNYVQFIGLPYRAMTASRLSSIAVYTTTNKLVNLRVDGTWLYISSPGTTFAEGEKVNAIITYIIG